MSLIAIIQGFQLKTFIPKKVIILTGGGRCSCHFILKQPFLWECLTGEIRRQATWLYHNHHGLLWSEGLVVLVLVMVCCHINVE